MKKSNKIKKKPCKFFSKFSNQIIMIFSLATTILIFTIVGFFYLNTSKVIKEEVISSNKAVLHQINKNFDDYIETLSDFSLNIRMDEKIMSMFLKRHLNYSDESHISSHMKNMYYSRQDITSINLYILQSGKTYFISRSNSKILSNSSTDITSMPWYDQASQEKKYLLIEPKTGVNDNFITLYRTIINVYNKKPLAVIAITCDKRSLDDLIDSLDQNRTDILYLLDENDTVFYSNNETAFESEFIQNITTKLPPEYDVNPEFKVDIDGKDYLVVGDISVRNGWKMIKFIPIDKINERISKIRNVSLLMMIFGTAFSVILIMVITNVLTSSLKRLSNQMELAGKGDLKTNVDVTGSYEVSKLANQYNEMITRIDTLIEESYLSKLNETTARLTALETQINPHFLYNALQVISAKAIVNKQKDIYRMVEALSFNLRYAFKEEGMVTIEMEMKHIESYLLLQEARFDERLAVKIDVEESTKRLLIPKISIYTLVENSAEHGLETTLDQVLIKIDIFKKGEKLIISVSDNGPGISRQRLEELQGWIKEDQVITNKYNSIGLRNLNSRIKILYKGEGTLKLESAEGKGTKTIMELPAKEWS